MMDQAVISCPQCLRQYEIDAATDSFVAMCGICKSHFTIIIPRLSGPADIVTVLENDISPFASFFKEACETMARNACIALRINNEVITPGSVMRLVEKVTKDSFISKIDKELGHEIAGADETVRDIQDSQAMAYFTRYLPCRPRYARDMLRSAFLGVLGGIEWLDANEEKGNG